MDKGGSFFFVVYLCGDGQSLYHNGRTKQKKTRTRTERKTGVVCYFEINSSLNSPNDTSLFKDLLKAFFFFMLLRRTLIDGDCDSVVKVVLLCWCSRRAAFASLGQMRFTTAHKERKKERKKTIS